MQNAFENALTSLDYQYQIHTDIDSLVDAFAEALDYPAKTLEKAVDSRANMVTAHIYK